MAKVHRSAIVEGDVQLADDVEVGPHCVLLGTNGPLRVGAGCVLISAVHLNGPLTMGERNVLYPNACLGFAPQDVNFDPNKGGAGAIIGDANVFREGFTLHRGKTEAATRVGNSNFFMTNSHVGHDASVANHCVLVSGALLAGHVQLDERVIMGGGSFVHQFCRVGRGVMVTGGVGASLDVPPWFTVTATNLAGSMNIVGMRRNGLSSADIGSVRWVYKMLYRNGMTPQQALPELEARADEPIVAEYIAFIRSSKRGICHGAGRATRGTSDSGNADRRAERRAEAEVD